MGKILVFGGSVFVGKGLASRLVEDGHQVYILNRGNHPAPEGTIQLVADRNDLDQLQNVLSGHRFDAVYDGSVYYESQTKLAIQALMGKTDHFIHISSAAVYQNTEFFPITEDSPRGPNPNWGDYSNQKYLSEELLFSAWKKDKFPITIIRPFYIYGPTNNLNRETYVFRRLLHGYPIILPGMGRPLIQFGHLDDLVDAMVKIMHREESFGEAYNVSGERAVTLKGWVEICAQVVGVESQILLVESEHVGHPIRKWFNLRDIHFMGSVEKIRDQLGIAPGFSLLEGLKHTYENLSKEELLKPFERSETELAIIQSILG